MPELSVGVLEERRNARLKELAGLGPTLQGSIATVGVKCGNKNCKCARGEKHVSNILTKKVNGKTKSVYVPVDMLLEHAYGNHPNAWKTHYPLLQIAHMLVPLVCRRDLCRKLQQFSGSERCLPFQEYYPSIKEFIESLKSAFRYQIRFNTS